MRSGETELEMVQRHVRQGKEQIARQQAVISRLTASDLPTGEAESLLVTFEELQRMHEAHLARVEGRSKALPGEQSKL